jgi:hypothetical protein
MILRLGVFAKSEIRHNTRLGERLVELAVRRITRSKRRRRR